MYGHKGLARPCPILQRIYTRGLVSLSDNPSKLLEVAALRPHCLFAVASKKVLVYVRSAGLVYVRSAQLQVKQSYPIFIHSQYGYTLISDHSHTHAMSTFSHSHPDFPACTVVNPCSPYHGVVASAAG
jgi:hypothetical protein